MGYQQGRLFDYCNRKHDYASACVSKTVKKCANNVILSKKPKYEAKFLRQRFTYVV